MPFSYIAKQKWFFYTHKWDARKDKLLVQSLLAKKEECKPLLPTESVHAIIFAMDALNDTYKAGFRRIDVDKRLDFLRKRYLAFKELMNKPETDWEQQKNVIHADDAVWIRLFKENGFYEAYHHRGEPLFIQLAALFGANDVKVEASHTVVIIEDSLRGKGAASTEFLDDTSSDDEVNSPVPVARKLFDDDAASSVSPVNSDYPTHLTAPWLLVEARNVGAPAPRKPKATNNTPEKGVEGSSCASCSPFK